MTPARRYRDIERALRVHGCSVKSTRGSHEKWVCPCGCHTAIIVLNQENSPGVVRDTAKRMQCLPEGWLQ